MISLDNLTVSYGGWTLFDNISLLINPKDRIGLVGKNGAGKTTLLRLIVGEQQPTSGSISYNGECTIGYLPQQMRVADTTTLVEETAKAFDDRTSAPPYMMDRLSKVQRRVIPLKRRYEEKAYIGRRTIPRGRHRA